MKTRSKMVGWLVLVLTSALLAAACGAELDRAQTADDEEVAANQSAATGCPSGYRRECTVEPEIPHHRTCECILVTLNCSPGTVQVDTSCVACGKNGQIACANGCEPGLAIWGASTCSPCGDEGQWSCGYCNAGLERRPNPNDPPWAQAGTCVRCGDVGQQICVTRAHCNAGLEEWNRACRIPVPRIPEPQEGCGGAEESCCTNPIYLRACTDPALVCRAQGIFHEGSDTCQPPLTPGWHPGGGDPPAANTAILCNGAPLAAGWLKTNDYHDATQCGNPHPENDYNVQVAERFTSKAVGTSMTICAGQVVPDGWQLTGQYFNPTACGHPSAATNNMWTIARLF